MLDRMRQLADGEAAEQLEEQRLRDSLGRIIFLLGHFLYLPIGSLLSSLDQLLSSFLVSEERTLEKERVRADEIDEGIRANSQKYRMFLLCLAGCTFADPLSVLRLDLLHWDGRTHGRPQPTRRGPDRCPIAEYG